MFHLCVISCDINMKFLKLERNIHKNHIFHMDIIIIIKGVLKIKCIKINKKDLLFWIIIYLLKEKNIYDTIKWRKNQGWGDIRNECTHKNKKEPNREDLIIGVKKIIKNIF
jgi:hypothetical protein